MVNQIKFLYLNRKEYSTLLESDLLFHSMINHFKCLDCDDML